MVSDSDLSVYLSEEDYENRSRSPRTAASGAQPGSPAGTSTTLPSPSTVARLSNAISSKRIATLAAAPPHMDVEEGTASAAASAVFESEADVEGSTSAAANPVFESEAAEAGPATAEAPDHNSTTSLRTSLTNDYKVAAAATQRARMTAESRRAVALKSGSTRSAGMSRETVVMAKASICVALILAAGLVALLMSPAARNRMLDGAGAG
jgi:hypothetical protein